MANIEGAYPTIERVELGLRTLDIALSGLKSNPNSPNEYLPHLGWPMTIYEVFGFQGIGKTTFSTSIAGMIAESYGKNIVYAPIEHVDRELMNSQLDSVGFKTGKVSILGGWDMAKKFLDLKKEKNEVVTDEIVLDCMIQAMHDDSYVFGILDSLTAISPFEEAESSVADKNMGRRARLAGALVRGLLHAEKHRTVPNSTILLSHKATSMSSTPTNTGAPTTGGETKKNIAKVRIALRRMPEPTMYNLDENAYILEGYVEKMNFGKDKRKFYVAVLGGKGIHKGLTAMYECKAYKLCTFGASITLDGKKYGRMSSIIERAHAGEEEFFQPFVDAIRNPSKHEKVSAEEEDEEFVPDINDGELPE